MRPGLLGLSSRATGTAGHPGWLDRRSRTARALGAQTIAFGLLAVQQVVLVPIFLHAWDVAVYAEWLVLFFAANLVRVTDLGLGYLLANRARAHAARGHWEGYRATLRVGCAAYGLHFVVTCPSLLLVAHLVGLQTLLNGQALAPWVFHGSLAVLVAGTLLSLGRDFLFMLYPAHGELDRGVLLFNVQLLARVSVVGVLLSAGFGPFCVSAGWALVDATAGLLLLFADLRRRHGWGRLLPDRRDWREVGERKLRDCPAYAASHVAEQLLLNAPVLILGFLHLPHLQVVIFNTARTYTNLARQFLTQYGRTFGVEAAQLAAVQTEAARRHLAKGIRFLGVIAGLLVGCLVGAAPLAYDLWIGGADVYRSDVILAMGLPLLLTGPAMASLAFLRSLERQDLVAWVLSTQALLSLVLGMAGAEHHGALGLALALSVAEVALIAGVLARRASMRLYLANPSISWGSGIAIATAVPTSLLASGLSTFVSRAMTS